MNWVTSMLAIGDLEDVENKEYTPRVANVLMDIRDGFDRKEPFEPIPAKINDIIDLIQDEIDDGKTVMIYCRAGMDRSPFVAATYLVKTQNIPYGEAYAIVQNARPQTVTHFEWAETMIDKPINFRVVKGKKLNIDLGDTINDKDSI